jgi:hypothetical protein
MRQEIAKEGKKDQEEAKNCRHVESNEGRRQIFTIPITGFQFFSDTVP